MNDTATLSERALHRLAVLGQIETGSLTAAEAAALLQLSRRQVRRLLMAYAKGGPTALVHGNRGRRPANITDPELVRQVLQLASTSYRGMTRRHLAETLAERHGIRLSLATVQRILKKRADLDRSARDLLREQPAADSY